MIPGRMVLMLFVMLSAELAYAQSRPEILAVPLSRPGEPILLEIDIPAAHIEVVGEERWDVELEITMTGADRTLTTPSGTQTLSRGSYELQVNEDDNAISIDTDWRGNRVTIVAHVPRRADLRLFTRNQGEIVVRDVAGNLQLENTDGPVSATNITGSVIAESVSGTVTAAMAALSEGGATALSSLSGDIHLILPADVGAELRLDNATGEIDSEFEVTVHPDRPTITSSRGPDGLSVRMENDIVATINGGGPVIRVETLNGNIRISKSVTR